LPSHLFSWSRCICCLLQPSISSKSLSNTYFVVPIPTSTWFNGAFWIGGVLYQSVTCFCWSLICRAKFEISHEQAPVD
jgi:hypothetical protein